VLGVEPDELHQLLHPAPSHPAVGYVVDSERIADDGAHGPAWVERAVRVLEHHLHSTPIRSQGAAAQPGDLLAVDEDMPRSDRLKAGDAARQRRLAAAGLTDEAERLAALHRQAHPVHGVHAADLTPQHGARAYREVLDDVANLQQRCGHAAPPALATPTVRCAHAWASRASSTAGPSNRASRKHADT
jgi:hypothetical protein